LVRWVIHDCFAGDVTVKIIHAQTVLAEDDLIALKSKCGESSTKEALSIAVQHYLECEYTDIGEQMWTKKIEKIVQKKQNK
jgi:hypothetical protein